MLPAPKQAAHRMLESLQQQQAISMSDYAIVQKVKYGNKVHYEYVSKYGAVKACFADSAKSNGYTHSEVSDNHWKLSRLYPDKEYEMVSESFIGKENP